METMGNLSTIISIIISLGFWAVLFYVIFRVIRKKKEGPQTEQPQSKEAAQSKIMKILKWRATSWRVRLVFLGLAGLLFAGAAVVIFWNIDTEEMISGEKTYYVKPETANVRECPSTSCKIIDTLSKNTELKVPGSIADKYPDWIEVTFPDGKVGYVSKSVLSSETSAEVAPANPPQGNEILLGEGDFSPAYVGQFYKISFCQPESARSGATCGGLTGDTQNPVGGSPPYSFVKSSGFFPPGMSLELNGLMTGAPTTAGTYNFNICAKDLQMNQGCQDYVLVVNNVVNERESNGVMPGNTNQASVVIDSVSCEVIGTDPIFNDPLYQLIVSGTVSGAIGDVMSVHFNPFGSGPGQGRTTTSSWHMTGSGEYNDLTRDAGDPPATSWKVVQVQGPGGNIQISATLYPEGTFTTVSASDSETVRCSP